MMLEQLKTLTGVPAGQIAERLMVPFADPQAYKEIRGGAAGAAGLTDIETAWMLERANEVFGPFGLGWVLDWQVDDVVSLGEGRITVYVKRAEFRFTLLDGEGHERVVVCPTTGGSTNEPAYALKGMETSCIGNALSKLRFQEDVYKGRLSHRNAAQVLKGNGRQARGVAAKAIEGQEPDASADPGTDIEIGMGKHAGKKLSEIGLEAVRWYAHVMRPTNEAARRLQVAAKRYLESTEESPAQPGPSPALARTT